MIGIFNIKDSRSSHAYGSRKKAGTVPKHGTVQAVRYIEEGHPIRLPEPSANDTYHRCIFKGLHSTVQVISIQDQFLELSSELYD